MEYNYVGSWAGRLGNNIISLGNAIAKSLERGQDLRYAYHRVLANKKFDFGGNAKGCRKWSGRQLFKMEFKNFQRHKIYQEFILPLLPDSITNPFVIYIRSGDIFRRRKKINDTYVQSPPSYIQYILELEKPSRIVVLWEDEVNPMVSFLNKYYSSIIDYGQSGRRDIRDAIGTMLGGQTLVQTGLTTFMSTLSLCSTHLRKIYIPQYEILPGLNACRRASYSVAQSSYGPEVEVIRVVHHNYIKVGEWCGVVKPANFDRSQLLRDRGHGKTRRKRRKT